jgi:hypothetical protein
MAIGPCLLEYTHYITEEYLRLTTFGTAAKVPYGILVENR